MASTVTVYTYAHSVAYVTEKMLSSIKQIIRDVGLDPSKFASNFNVYDVGVRTWLESKHLKQAVLEEKPNLQIVALNEVKTPSKIYCL